MLELKLTETNEYGKTSLRLHARLHPIVDSITGHPATVALFYNAAGEQNTGLYLGDLSLGRDHPLIIAQACLEYATKQHRKPREQS